MLMAALKFTLIAGMVNVQAEIVKLEKKEAALLKSIEGTLKKMQAPNYEEKTPENVKETFKQKLLESQEELEKVKIEVNRLRGALN